MAWDVTARADVKPSALRIELRRPECTIFLGSRVLQVVNLVVSYVSSLMQLFGIAQCQSSASVLFGEAFHVSASLTYQLPRKNRDLLMRSVSIQLRNAEPVVCITDRPN